MKKTYIISLQSYGNEKTVIEEALLNHISVRADSFGFTTDNSRKIEQFSRFIVEKQDMEVSWIKEEDDAELTDLESQEQWIAYKFTLNPQSLSEIRSANLDHDLFFYSEKEAFVKRSKDDSYEILLEEDEVDRLREDLIALGLREEDFFKL